MNLPSGTFSCLVLTSSLLEVRCLVEEDLADIICFQELFDTRCKELARVILETKYPIKIPKKEIFNILNELESNFDIFIKHESYFIDNYISLYSKTNSVRAKTIIFNIIIHQLTLIDTVSFFNTTVSLINNSLFNSRAELLNQLLSSRIMEIFKTGNGEMIISVIMTIKKYKNFSEIQLLKILNKASKNLSIKCYISISDYLYKNIKSEIARRILSKNREKWQTIGMAYQEIDTLRDQAANRDDEEELKKLDEINEFIMSIEKKYEIA